MFTRTIIPKEKKIPITRPIEIRPHLRKITIAYIVQTPPLLSISAGS
jgi:hypothetical protein